MIPEPHYKSWTINDDRIRFSSFQQIDEWARTAFIQAMAWEREIWGRETLWFYDDRRSHNSTRIEWHSKARYYELVDQFSTFLRELLRSGEIVYLSKWTRRPDWGTWAIRGVTPIELENVFEYLIEQWDEWYETSSNHPQGVEHDPETAPFHVVEGKDVVLPQEQTASGRIVNVFDPEDGWGDDPWKPNGEQ